jgi:hypothetical protein
MPGSNAKSALEISKFSKFETTVVSKLAENNDDVSGYEDDEEDTGNEQDTASVTQAESADNNSLEKERTHPLLVPFVDELDKKGKSSHL